MKTNDQSPLQGIVVEELHSVEYINLVTVWIQYLEIIQ